MKIGFTGTREGMTEAQMGAVWKVFRKLTASELQVEAHHGDCVGADKDFHDLTFGVKFPMQIIRIGHPPTDDRLRAFCDCDRWREPKYFTARNRDIVDETDVLIAAPKEMEPPPSLRGQGTWSTYFYAKDKAKKPTYLVLPDGTVKGEDS